MSVACVIMDLDGCIANSERRIVHAPDWVKVLEDCENDPIYGDMAYLWHYWQRFMPIVILTGRYEISRKPTEAWLKYHQFEYAKMIMRPEKNVEASQELKKTWVHYIRECGFNPTMAYDDHIGVAKEYAKLGIITHLVVRDFNYEDLESN